MDKRIFDPSIPYTGPISEGMFVPYKIIRILGTVPNTACRFNVNLQCGSESNSHSNTAVRILVQLEDDQISLNSMVNGIWGDEQCEIPSPIQRAKNFEIILLCTPDQYKVTINGHHCCEFSQRIHYGRVTHLAIDGDVSIVQISYEAEPEDAEGGTSVLDSESTNFSSCSYKRYPLNPLSESPPPPYETIVPLDNQVFSPPFSFLRTGLNAQYPSCNIPGVPCIPVSSQQSASRLAAFNLSMSNSHPVNRSTSNKCCYYLCSIIFGLAFICAMVVIKIGRT